MSEEKERLSTNGDVMEAQPPAQPAVKRETWTRKIDFLLALIGFSVGLGNVWRFPYLCYKNGGGAFLIPYLLSVVLAGIPVFFLEVTLGQFMSEGGVNAWNISPLFKGIGLACVVIVFNLNIYYNVILSWAFYYLFSSFTSRLPWADCGHSWNTENCTDFKAVAEERQLNATLNGTIVNGTIFNATARNVSAGVDPVTEFWIYKVLKLSSGVDKLGTIRWELALCLLLAWIVVYFCIWKGIKSSGKVMYFTATSPYVLMLVLLIRGATLEGALDGIKLYVIPQWDRLADPLVWVDAGTQIFFSYSLAIGVLTALGSYNEFHHNSYKDCILFAMANSGTSLVAGFVIFSVLGFMAHQQGVDVRDVAESGPGLAFIAYPKALSQLPISPLWSILFFIMVILLGLDSQFVGVEGFVTAIVDFFPQLRKGRRREIFIACVCFCSFLFGLIMVTEGGMYVFQIYDYYSGSRVILLVALLETIIVAYVYGANRYYDDLEFMFGFRINPWMKICWWVITPIFCVVIFIMSAVAYSDLTYNKTYIYPQWAIGLGWMLAMTSIIFVPIIMAVLIAMEKGPFMDRVRKLLKPDLKPFQQRRFNHESSDVDSVKAEMVELTEKS